MEKITIREIADKLNLSVATVSRATNPQTAHLVKRSTRKRVLELARDEQYVPSIAARRLATGKSRNITIFLRPQVSSLFFDDYYSKLIAGAMTAADASSYNLNLSIMKEERRGFDLAKAIRGMDIAGAIICSILGVFKLSTKSIPGLPIPVLVINQYTSEDNPACFLVDNFKSAYDAAMYLIGRGHRRIGFVRGSPSVKDAQDRYMGHRAALADSGIKYDVKLEYQSNFLEESGRKAIRYYFSGTLKAPSAIFFSNDAMAMTAINEARHMGISCPGEVSIIGFDGIDAGRYTDPPLTTSMQPIHEMALEAVRQIIRNAENGDRFTGTKHFTAKIIERGSVSSFNGDRKGGADVH